MELGREKLAFTQRASRPATLGRAVARDAPARALVACARGLWRTLRHRTRWAGRLLVERQSLVAAARTSDGGASAIRLSVA